MNRLDRLIFFRVAANTILIAFGTTLLALGLEMIMEANQLFGTNSASGSERFWMIVSYYGYKIAPTLSPLLPIAFLAGMLITFTAMLRRNELIVVVAGGLSLRRVCRSLLAMACLLGLTDFILVDRIMPYQEGDRLALENQLTGQQTGARLFTAPNGNRWAARSVTLIHNQPPAADGVFIISDQQILQASQLRRGVDGWQLYDVVVSDRGAKQQQPRRHAELPAQGQWDLPLSNDQLRAVLASTQALPAGELWRRGGRQNEQVVYGRLLHLITCLAILLAALPVYVRYQNRTNLVSAAGSAIAVGIVTWGCCGGMASLAGLLPLPVLPGMLLGLCGLFGVLIWRYSRWSL